MIEYLKSRPMLISALICGLISVLCFYTKYLELPLILALALIFILFIFKRQFKSAVVASALILTALSCFFENQSIAWAEALNGSIHTAELTVLNELYEGEDFCVAYAEVIKSETIKKGSKILVYYNDSKIDIGQKINDEFEIKALDTKRDMNHISQEVYLKASLNGYTLTGKDCILNTISKIRAYIRESLFKNIDYSEAATLSALLFGDKSYFSAEFSDNVRASGVSHIMVVSGMHLSVFVAIFTYIFEKYIYNRYLKALGVAAVVILMMALCGFTMSMFRAGITYLLMALALCIGRKGVADNTLGTAVSMILVFSPYAVFNLSFQLSVLSTFGILAVALPIIKYLIQSRTIESKLLLALISSALITLSALILTLPVTVYNFGSVSTVAIITNLIISSAVTLAVWISVMGLFINLIIPFLSPPLFWAAECITKYINFIINTFGSLDFAELSVARWSFIPCIIFIAVIFYFLIACKSRLNMIKLSEMQEKITREGGKRLKWR